jgi:hypothetical protein
MSSIIGLGGFSNSGKSTSLKYLNPKETFIISCTNKQLQIPGFRKKYPKVEIKEGKLLGNWYISNSYTSIEKIMDAVSRTRPEIKVIVVDDANYLLSNETFQTALQKGYEKFSVMAKNYYDLIESCLNYRDDLSIVFISHLENWGTDIDPKYRLWTTGKMLTTQVNLDGLFSYLLYAEKYEDEESGDIKFRFRTKPGLEDTCRTVSGCFEDKYIEPNMKLVIDTINKFENGDE